MSGLKFGWKRKAGSQVNKSTVLQHQDDEKEDIDLDVDWFAPERSQKKQKLHGIEDAETKAYRLKNEGCILAENERFWEAIKKWDEALLFSPNDETILEMKAQALMSVNEVCPAVEVAQKVTCLVPTWWVGYQTLGRSQLNLGEVKMALRSFSRAVLLNPADQELWQEDLQWCRSLLDRRQATSIAGNAASSHECANRNTTLSQEDANEDLKKSSGDHSDNPQDKTVITFQNSDTVLEDSDSENFMDGLDSSPQVSEAMGQRQLRQVPQDYVHMRDPT